MLHENNCTLKGKHNTPIHCNLKGDRFLKKDRKDRKTLLESQVHFVLKFKQATVLIQVGYFIMVFIHVSNSTYQQRYLHLV